MASFPSISVPLESLQSVPLTPSPITNPDPCTHLLQLWSSRYQGLCFAVSSMQHTVPSDPPCSVFCFFRTHILKGTLLDHPNGRDTRHHDPCFHHQLVSFPQPVGLFPGHCHLRDLDLGEQMDVVFCQVWEGSMAAVTTVDPSVLGH